MKVLVPVIVTGPLYPSKSKIIPVYYSFPYGLIATGAVSRDFISPKLLKVVPEIVIEKQGEAVVHA